MSKESNEFFRCEDKPKDRVTKKIDQVIKKLESNEAVNVPNVCSGTAEFNETQIDSSNNLLGQSRFLRDIYIGIVAWMMRPPSKGSEGSRQLPVFWKIRLQSRLLNEKSKNPRIIRGDSQ